MSLQQGEIKTRENGKRNEEKGLQDIDLHFHLLVSFHLGLLDQSCLIWDKPVWLLTIFLFINLLKGLLAFFFSPLVLIFSFLPLIHRKFIAALIAAAKKMVGPDPKNNSSLSRIVNERHWDRVMRLLSSPHGGEVSVLSLLFSHTTSLIPVVDL